MTDPTYRRHVFYVHGFDRRGPRFFNLWQKREARLYRERFASDVSVGALMGDRWVLTQGNVETVFHFLDWSDVIRDRFDAPFWVGAWTMVRLGVTAIRQNMIWRVFKCDWAMGLLMGLTFGPMFLFLLVLLLALLGGLGFAAIWAVIGVAGFWALNRFDRYFGVYYAAHIAWAARRMALKDDPRIEAHVAAFQSRVSAAKGDEDEVVIVGHSVGCALALRLLESAPGASFLSVGQSIPLVSYQAEAQAERDVMASYKGTWIDISGGRDPLGFCAYDPSGGRAQCYSAHLGRSFEEEVKRLKWSGFEMHFLYFRAPFERVSTWDWMDILTGRQALSERFEGERRFDGDGARRMFGH